MMDKKHVNSTVFNIMVWILFMLGCLLSFIVIFCPSSESSSSVDVDEAHKQWMMEFNRTYANRKFFNMRADDIPESINWIEQGAVTSIKEQTEFRGFQVIPPNDEQQLLQAVVQQPVKVTNIIKATFGSCSIPEDISREIFSSKIAVFNMSADAIPESVNWIENEAIG
ncbi:hypothetical protein L195_g026308 [Trifolium pratense]|uniref:Uncharacterized protein n=1 Tax=Trifolium pratense TaxID=57577 RepID=A0A2K3NIV2_TRIPR|nr:hypothetical protein L195_g026308 [Trifolium pratense]